ncbi:MAG: sodium/proline symporter PutP [Gammaproteobacteria bacterium]
MHYLPVIVTFATYFLMILAIGYIASRYTNNLSDYVLGGRSLSGPIAALGAGASDMSGWLLLGLPGAVFSMGLNQIWLPVGLSIGAYINWLLIAKRLRIYTEVANDSLTIPAYLEHRFHDNTAILRSVTGIVILIFFTIYASAGFVGGALLFQSTFDISYEHALWISALFLVLYTSIGGFLAVNWVDFLQGTLMLFALIIVPSMVIFELGGWHHTLHSAQQLNTHLTQAFRGLNTIGIISLLAWGLGYFGQPHILVRFMAAKSTQVLPMARRICMNWMVLSLAGSIMTGFVGIAYYNDASLNQPETVFLSLATDLFNPWVAGILLAAVLSAIMSTIAAQLLASSSALTADFYHRFFRKHASQKELVSVSRLTVWLIALVAILLARNPESRVLTLVSHAWAGLGASFGPIIVVSLFWRNATRDGAIAGIISGAISIFLFQYLQRFGGIFAIYEIVPAFFIGTMMIIIVSKRSTPANAVLTDFDKVKAHLHQ